MFWGMRCTAVVVTEMQPQADNLSPYSQLCPICACHCYAYKRHSLLLFHTNSLTSFVLRPLSSLVWQPQAAPWCFAYISYGRNLSHTTVQSVCRPYITCTNCTKFDSNLKCLLQLDIATSWTMAVESKKLCLQRFNRTFIGQYNTEQRSYQNYVIITTGKCR